MFPTHGQPLGIPQRALRTANGSTFPPPGSGFSLIVTAASLRRGPFLPAYRAALVERYIPHALPLGSEAPVDIQTRHREQDKQAGENTNTNKNGDNVPPSRWRKRPSHRQPTTVSPVTFADRDASQSSITRTMSVIDQSLAVTPAAFRKARHSP